MAVISFFSDEVEFLISNERGVTSWLTQVVADEKELLSDLNVIFMSDEKLLGINKQFLKHDFYTDVITFPNYGEVLSGEIYISIDRVKENAQDLKAEFIDELHRVILHGLLHILGYKDKSDNEVVEMRSKEEFYLNLRKF